MIAWVSRSLDVDFKCVLILTIMYKKAFPVINICVFCCLCLFCSNLKKCEESVARVQAELEENEKSMAELTEKLKKLEQEAGEIMTACQEAEVGAFYSLKISLNFI